MKYAGEMHFVHINRVTGRLAVLGFFIQSDRMTANNASVFSTEVGLSTANEWSKYFNAAAALEQINNSTRISLNVAALMGRNVGKFWRYDGSLTNPPCTEVVTWTVFITPILFSDTLLNAFRTKLFGTNDRHPQPLNGRVVYRNYVNETMSSPSDYTCCPGNFRSNARANAISNFFLILLILNFH